MEHFAFSLQIFLNIESFLSQYDYVQFLNTSKGQFTEIKRLTRKISLRGKRVETFLEDLVYKEEILGNIFYPSQLHLNCRGTGISHQMDALQKHKGCDISLDMRNTPLKKIVTKSKEGFNIDWLNSRNMVSLARFKELRSLTGIRDINILRISECRDFCDTRSLSCIRELYLESCPSIVDVSRLQNLKKMAVSNCIKIETLQELTGLESISLESCPRLKTLNGLSSVKRITAKDCPALEAISGFKGNPVITVENCPLLKPINVMKLSEVKLAKVHNATVVANPSTFTQSKA